MEAWCHSSATLQPHRAKTIANTRGPCWWVFSMESDACTTENLPSHSGPCLYPGGNEASTEGKPWGQQVTMDQAASGCSCFPPDPCWLHGQILWKETPAWGNEPTLLGLHMKRHSIHRKPPTYQSPLGSHLLDKYHASPSKRRPLLFNLLENSTANIALPLPPMKFFPLCVPPLQLWNQSNASVYSVRKGTLYSLCWPQLVRFKMDSTHAPWPIFASAFVVYHAH